MPDILPTLMNLFLRAVILCSMLVIGFSLTIQQIPVPAHKRPDAGPGAHRPGDPDTGRWRAG